MYNIYTTKRIGTKTTKKKLLMAPTSVSSAVHPKSRGPLCLVKCPNHPSRILISCKLCILLPSRRPKQPLVPQNHRDWRVQTPPYEGATSACEGPGASGETIQTHPLVPHAALPFRPKHPTQALSLLPEAAKRRRGLVVKSFLHRREAKQERAGGVHLGGLRRSLVES